jgi:glycosyltransferase involved in cell wall biosynthesis
MNIFRFHVLGVPHTVSSTEFTACAFTQKVVKFCEMMMARGHEIIHYGHEDSVIDATEHVSVLTNEDWKIAYGDYDWKKTFFKYDVNDHAYQTFYKNTIREISTRKQAGDFILPFWGNPMKVICDAHPDLICVEPGIGYAYGHFAPYKIFESYAAHSAYYGLESLAYCNEKWYDVVIPNYFKQEDFKFETEKDDYFLYIGRVYDGKGVNIAIQVTEQIGAKLIIAGQGSLKEMGYDKVPDHVQEIGFAGVEKRKQLMSKAKGLFAPSLYNEPFCGTHIEAMFSGTPVITTDWGAFTEYNIHGVTGYRCRTFEHFVWAAKNIDKINPNACYEWATQNFGYDKVGAMYEEFFSSLLNIHGKNGWYEPNDNRNELDWLKKEYPVSINTI